MMIRFGNVMFSLGAIIAYDLREPAIKVYLVGDVVLTLDGAEAAAMREALSQGSLIHQIDAQTATKQ